MKTDRELLELAARAAGYRIDHAASLQTWREHRRLALLNPSGGHTLWNSEDDSGDAFRLSVKLEIQSGYSEFSGCGFASWNRGTHSISEYGPQDPAAATRRAIVRAAAAIGEAMP
jgi:hypothetical protein